MAICLHNYTCPPQISAWAPACILGLQTGHLLSSHLLPHGTVPEALLSPRSRSCYTDGQASPIAHGPLVAITTRMTSECGIGPICHICHPSVHTSSISMGPCFTIINSVSIPNRVIEENRNYIFQVWVQWCWDALRLILKGTLLPFRGFLHSFSQILVASSHTVGRSLVRHWDLLWIYVAFPKRRQILK